MNKVIATKEERLNTRLVIYGEIFFALLPFIIIAFASIQNRDILTLWYGSELSLAAIILSGQALMRFVSGLIKFEGKKHWERASCWILVVLFLPIICLLDFSVLRFADNPSTFFYVLQIVLFLLSLFVYIIFGGAGQLLLSASRQHRN